MARRLRRSAAWRAIVRVLDAACAAWVAACTGARRVVIIDLGVFALKLGFVLSVWLGVALALGLIWLAWAEPRGGKRGEA